MNQGKTQQAAAAAAGMSVRSARKWQSGPLPSQTKEPRHWRTRKDPFEGVWEEKIVPLLERDKEGELEAKTLLKQLIEEKPERFNQGQLRTMQRRVRDWRALHGPDKEVYFQQEHPPGEEAALDFTNCNELQVTIAGEPFRHLLFELVLVASAWTWACVALSESYEALVEGLQRALWALGGVPRKLTLDNMSAATHELKKARGRSLNKRFADACTHLGIETVRRINVGKSHENGAVEVRHRRTKKLLKQALILRGSRDFASVEDYERFVQQTLEREHNQHVTAKLELESPLLRPLPIKPVPTYTTETPKVRRWSTIKVRGRIYSVPSQLIGHQVEVRLHANEVELRYGGEVVETFPRLRGEGAHRIDYRHVIASLVRKPGAFPNYCFREELYPSLIFRRAYDALERARPGRGHVDYVRILHLAAMTMESTVEAELAQLLEAGAPFDYATVKQRVQPTESEVPQLEVGEPDLGVYDELLGGAA
ncbi:IS21 family transposase [Pseudenhygromyxa sp. WMMC2535]|uniref:IS21 family transposase n=1 Tax=Pseudenhygromyxa sp. WMMC2535 TaxID=2712867 RepID=UPI0015573D62|nr:IS21 family transposase [Pseudenhygromyxa sp. WMMC2535]NVB36387.1 IS21 family transposase [Pseudenhygromyxa sp. WMMC2535]NVB36396.1 IS21 family transposase [Pseudenhygromyxa sp. WMMC2535]NVB36408.1 IS21 family transposase [Pseudenhygromyxa sp. WMMC2535]NVB38765.1 IS21 family transposase [Pseudenhygromyxa sp. WMMC2535]NVB39961.1 IS21 family transposase [Pseudenhygromyxa sp. WMMC2535]